MSELKFGICGEFDRHNTPREDNPMVTLKKPKVKGEVLEKIEKKLIDLSF